MGGGGGGPFPTWLAPPPSPRPRFLSLPPPPPPLPCSRTGAEGRCSPQRQLCTGTYPSPDPGAWRTARFPSWR